MARIGGTVISAAVLTAVLGSGPALADAKVATDIPPVHSLVARVMQGVGEPALVLPPGASPHGHAMRPSEAAALAGADLVVWTGPALTPWLDRAVGSLAEGAASLELLDVPGTFLLGFREGTAFEPHDHADEADHRAGTGEGAAEDAAEHHHHTEGEGQDEHGHGHDEGQDGHDDRHADGEDHNGHGHHAAGEGDDEHDRHHAGGAGQDGHDHAEGEGPEGPGDQHAEGEAHGEDDDHGDGEHGHDRAGVDPHAWLDPQNARLWLDAIAEALAEADPENAATYRRNAADGRAEIEALSAELADSLAAARDKPFIVFHDAYHYFERRFGVEAAGAIALADASTPGPARIAAVRDAIAESGAACVFAEPQFPADLIATVTEGSQARAATLDPIGASLPPGPTLYAKLLRGLAAGLRGCLAPDA